MSVETFNAALRATLPIARAEAESRVAIITFEGPVSMNAASRRRIVAMAREHGFSNVAVELTPDANLPGDQSAR